MAVPDGALPAAIGRFRVETEIGRGMMGVVYKAHDPVMDRPVALKVVRLAFAVSDEQTAEFEQRFLSEARIVARLSHPNIVVAYDVGLAGEHGPPYVAFEYLTGRTLAAVLSAGPPEWREALHLVARLARALHYAHEQGVVHRDIKPANVMLLDSGEPKLMDFGLAKLDSGLEKSATGPFVGTPLYMSPEQALGAAVDARSDLFSLGALAYTLLTGRRAFEAESVPSILRRVIHESPPPPTRVNRSLPSSVDYLLARALAKPREARYPDGATLAEDFEDVLDLRPPRHRSGWVPPAAVGEETLDSPRLAAPVAPANPHTARAAAAALDLRPAPREGRDAVLELSRPEALVAGPDVVGEHALGARGGADSGATDTARAEKDAPATARRVHVSLTLLVISMLAFGATLVMSAFWRQQLADVLGVSVVISPLLEAPPDSGATVAPSAAAAALAEPTSPSPEPSPAAATEAEAALASPPASPAQDTQADEPAPEAAQQQDDTGSQDASTPAPATVASEDPPPTPDTAATPENGPAAAASEGASPAPDPGSPTPTPAATAKPAPRRAAAPRATARLRVSVTHDLKSARLKVLIDGRTVVDQALRARRKRYLLVFQRREGTLESRLAVVPGRRRITVQVRSGSRLHAEELRETFVAGATRQLNLRVSGRDGLAFDWE